MLALLALVTGLMGYMIGSQPPAEDPNLVDTCDGVELAYHNASPYEVMGAKSHPEGLGYLFIYGENGIPKKLSVYDKRPTLSPPDSFKLTKLGTCVNGHGTEFHHFEVEIPR